jgi:hypothetical protein
MIDDDVSFVMKNLAIYNEEQRRQRTGHVDQLHLSTNKDDTSVSSLNNDPTKQMNENNSDLDQFFHNSDLSSMTPESRSLLDDMFSS